MNVNDIKETFRRIQEAMVSQKNVITGMQQENAAIKKDLASMKKELAEALSRIDELSSGSDSEDQDDVEVVQP